MKEGRNDIYFITGDSIAQNLKKTMIQHLRLWHRSTDMQTQEQFGKMASSSFTRERLQLGIQNQKKTMVQHLCLWQLSTDTQTSGVVGKDGIEFCHS